MCVVCVCDGSLDAAVLVVAADEELPDWLFWMRSFLVGCSDEELPDWQFWSVVQHQHGRGDVGTKADPV